MSRSTSSPTKATPEYDESLVAYQHAFHVELDRGLDMLSLTKSMRVLDVPCGNGFYSRLLAHRLGAAGRLDAVDLCHVSLTRTRNRLRRARCDCAVHESDAYNLPFDDDTFDVAWCAQSLISLDDPLRAIQEMKRVVRTGGMIAILENDVFHQVLLPWPVDLEVPVQRAIQVALRARFGSPAKFSPVRWLPRLIQRAGLRSPCKHTFAADRTSPWTADVREFLKYHVRDISRLLRGRLSPKVRAAYRRFVDPRNPASLFGDGPMDLTCLNVLYCVTK